MDNNTSVQPVLAFIADEALTEMLRSRPSHARSRQQLAHRDEFGGHCVGDRCMHDSSGALDVWVIAAGISVFALLVNEIIIVKLAIATAAFLHFILSQLRLRRHFALHRRDAALAHVTVADVYRYWNNTSARALSGITSDDPLENQYAYLASRLEATNRFGATLEMKNAAASMVGEIRNFVTLVAAIAENPQRFLTIATNRPAHRLRLHELSQEQRDTVVQIDDWLHSANDFAEWIGTLRTADKPQDHTEPFTASEMAEVEYALDIFGVEFPQPP